MKSILAIFVFILSAVLAVIPARASGFVTTQGQHFYLNGKLYSSIGVNRYNLLTLGGKPFIGCGGTFTDQELDTWFAQLQQMGVSSVRFWLFQSFTQGGTNLDRFNYVLSLAQKYNVRIIPVFENQQAD